jgi:hypothetical protein
MKKFSFFLLFLVICFYLTGCKKQAPVQKVIDPDDFGVLYNEENGGFSMYAPQGWQLVEGDQNYLIMMGDVEDGFTPNINFNLIQFGGKVSEVINATLAEFPLIFNDFKLMDRGTFTINNGLKGEYILSQFALGDIRMRQKMYLLPNKRNTAIMAIYCSVSPDTGGKYDFTFDDCVKTFEWK